MQARVAGAFATGFALGALFIALALLISGTVRNRAADHGSADRQSTEKPGAGAPRISLPISGVDPAKLTDTFTQARQGGLHHALDIPSARGTPVLAAADGPVAKLFHSVKGGIAVYQFDRSGDWCFYYAHLDRYAPGLKEGGMLRAGDVLGYVGSTGDASPDAPHLHFAVYRLGPEKKWWKGRAVNPLPLLRGRASLTPSSR